MTIYRVQDKDGRGPWKPGFSHKWIEIRPDHDNLLPWPLEFGRVDKLAKSSEHVGCGCISLDQLRRWFTPLEYKTLLSFGYKAVVITNVRILGSSNIQCVFSRNKPLKKKVKAFSLYG